MVGTDRSFVLKYRFKNVSNIKDTEKCISDEEDHFGVPWYIGIDHNKEHLGAYLYCRRSKNKKEWSIDAEYEIHILNPIENSFHEFSYRLYCFTEASGYGPSDLMTWERMEKEFLQNDELVVEIRVKINEITGIEEKTEVNLNMSGIVDKLSPVERQINQENRSFVLKHLFKNVSTMKDMENLISKTEDHFGVPWFICISHNKDHLGVYLYCRRTENRKEWSIDTEYEIHVLHPNGNTAHKNSGFFYCFTEAKGRGEKELMRWERMEKEFLQNDELVVEIRVKINEITGIEEKTEVNLNMSGIVDELSPVEKQTDQKIDDFVLKHVFKDVSKIKDFSCRSSPTEDHSGIPWSMTIDNLNDHLYVFLNCGGPGNKTDWSVDIEYEIHVHHPNGNPAHKVSDFSYCFKEPRSCGHEKLMTWKKMEKEFLLNDELVVEIRVKINRITGTEYTVYLNPRPRSFVLKHVFKNVLELKDTEDCKGPIEYHFIAPWFLRICNQQEHLGVGLHCDRWENEKEWSIDTEFEIHVLNPNGYPALKASVVSHRFTEAIGRGRIFMTWERMKEEFLHNDELVVEIRVTITNFTGIKGIHLNMSETDDKLFPVEEQTNQKTDEFVLKHVFKNVSTVDDEGCYGPTENHFGVPWCLRINHGKEHLGVFLRCARSKNKKEWSIDTDFEIHVLHPNGNTAHKSSRSFVFTKDIGRGRSTIMTWERMEREFLLNDELVVEIRVKIIQMAGIEDPNLNSPLSTYQYQMNRRPRSFVLKHVLKNVSKITEESFFRSQLTYFKVPWCMLIAKKDDHLGVHLLCGRRENKKEWSIDTECEINVFRTNGSPFCKPVLRRFTTDGRCGWNRFITWGRMEEECVANDEVVIEIRVKITNMAGIEEFLRLFNDEEGSDVALVVDGKKFHVSKLYLASQSSYFEKMFLEKFNESEKTEIELTGIDAFDLQKYLEMLYGEDALDDDSVKGILHLVDMYDTKNLVKKCEKYLMDVSTIPLEKKFEISKMYNLPKLKYKTAYVLVKAYRSPKTVSMKTPSITH